MLMTILISYLTHLIFNALSLYVIKYNILYVPKYVKTVTPKMPQNCPFFGIFFAGWFKIYPKICIKAIYGEYGIVGGLPSSIKVLCQQSFSLFKNQIKLLTKYPVFCICRKSYKFYILYPTKKICTSKIKFFMKQIVFLYIAKFYGIFYILGKWVIEKKSALRKISILLEKCQL